MMNHLYIELWLLVKDLAVIALAAEMIDTVVDVVVILVVVLRQRGRFLVRRIIGATVVLVLGQIGVRQQRRRQMLEAGVVGVDDAAAARRQISFLGPVGPVGRREFARRILLRRVTACKTFSQLRRSQHRSESAE